MLKLTVFDKELKFEHSLVSLSEWEAKFEKPFFAISDKEEKTEEEMLSYFEYMYVGKEKWFDQVRLVDADQMMEIIQYINSSRTATIVRDISPKTTPSNERTTSELIYYWMVAFKIPFSPAESWHINRLLMLIRVCSIKDAPPNKSKQSRHSRAEEMRALNEARRAKTGSKG